MTAMAARLIEPIVVLMIQPVTSLLVKGIFGKRVSEVQKSGIFPWFDSSLSLLKGIFEKEVMRAGDIIIWITWIKFFDSAPSFKQ